MFILLVECGLVHRGEPAFVWPSLGRADSLCLACKPFRVFVRLPELAGDARQWWQLVFTNRAARRSQISSLDSCCAIRFSKTLDVVHRYALLVSNSDML